MIDVACKYVMRMPLWAFDLENHTFSWVITQNSELGLVFVFVIWWEQRNVETVKRLKQITGVCTMEIFLV